MKLTADIVLTGGKVLTFSEEEPEAEAVAMGHGRILAVGKRAEAMGFAGPETKVMDLEGRRVLPGFTDSHSHLATVGSRLSGLDLSNASSLEDLLTMVQRRARSAKPGEWIFGRNWDESTWPIRRYPRKEDVDPVTPRHPVVLLRVDGHLAAANSRALERLPLQTLVGVECDEAGSPTGVLKEEAAEVAWHSQRPAIDEIAAGIREMVNRAHALGVTSIHDVVDRREIAAYLALYRQGKLKLRVNLMPRAEVLASLLGGGIATGLGDRCLRLGPLKVFFDGSIGARTAALHRDFVDDPGNSGLLMAREEELFGSVLDATKGGFQLALHAIGDLGIDVALKAISRTDFLGRRHRVEHLELPGDHALKEAKRLGVVASMQPNFIGRWGLPGGLYEGRLGAERTRRSNPLRRVLDEGIPLTFGSDHMPFSPMYGVHWAVNAPYDEQRLTVEEALRCYTCTPAYASFEEMAKGTLEPGKLADLVVLEKDPFKSPEDIQHIGVHMTVFNGEVVHKEG